MIVLRFIANANVRRVLGDLMLDDVVGYSTAVVESRSPACREYLCESLELASMDVIGKLAATGKTLVVVGGLGVIAKEVTKAVSSNAGNARVLAAGIDSRSAVWGGQFWSETEQQDLCGIRFVCSGMPEVYSVDVQSAAFHEDIHRYSRLTGAIGNVALRLRSLKVMVVGAGRNGSAILQQLALLGVGALTIVDRDVLQTENLDATVGVNVSQVGLPKARAIAESLCRLRDDLSVTCLVKSASHRDVLEAARTTDLIVSCVDNDAPRLAAAKIARQLLRPHLDIGTGITQQPDGTRMIAGDARLLMPGDGCVCCVGGLRNRSDAEFELRSPPNALRREKPVAWNQERMGSLITINSMAVSTGVQLWLDLLSGSLPGSTWHRIRWVEGKGLESQASPVGASAVCDLCNRW